MEITFWNYFFLPILDKFLELSVYGHCFRLADLDVYLAQMNEIQRKWIYLEPIFGRGALPSEASRFARVDSEFRAILAGAVFILCPTLKLC